MGLLSLFEKSPAHPLADSGELDRVLDGLPERPLEALQELQHWLGTVAEFDGFPCDTRLTIAKRIDERGAPLLAAVFGEFYAHAHQRDRVEFARQETLHAYWTNLSAAYGRCVSDNEKGEKRAREIREELPLALARAYRAASMACKVACLMYLPASAVDWARMYRLLVFSETVHFDAATVRLYEREVRSTPRAELTKLLAFELTAPHGLPPEQVELAARILDRFAISFAWASAPSPACTAFIDLAAGGPPRFASSAEAATPARRYFGAGPALAKLAELESLSARNLLSEEMRFGADFSPTQIVTVIRHLLNRFAPAPPARRKARTAAAQKIEVVRGFAAICQRVVAINIGGDATLQEDLKLARERRSQSLQVEAEVAETPPESWQLTDRSEWGAGAAVPAASVGWVEPGVLCGIREKESLPWGVAIIRRLDLSAARSARCGIQILSRKPVSVWLRVLGREGLEASNWESSTGSFSYDYTRAIVLSDAPKEGDRPIVLLEGGKFVPGQMCEILMGERSRHIKLAEFLEQGADYLRATFDWIAPGKS